MQIPNSLRGGPDERGYFGIYGGRFVAETLMPLVLAVEAAYAEARNDPGFQAEHVVDLVRAGVVELVALQIEFCTAEMAGQPLGKI